MTEAAVIWESAGALLVAIGGGGAIVLGLSSWLGKVWAQRLMSGQLATHQRDLEKLKMSLQQLASENAVRFARIDSKQAEVIATIYSHVYNLRRGLVRLDLEFDGRKIREDVDRTRPEGRRPEYDLKGGIDTLSKHEQETVDRLAAVHRELADYFGTHRLYLPLSCCAILDRFTDLSLFVAHTYEAVAVKDREGNLYVSPVVKETWDAARGALPQLLLELEAEFRRLVGVE